MDIQFPDPPANLSDLNSIPTHVSDAGLLFLQEEIESGNIEEHIETLTADISEDERPDLDDEAFHGRALAYVEDCITYRRELRPNSLRNHDELPESVGRQTASSWVHYSRVDEELEHDIPADEAEIRTKGKYLFFTPQVARVLEDVILQELPKRPFRGAKIPTQPAKRDDWVLVLYAQDDRYFNHFETEYADISPLRFKGYKSKGENRYRDG